MQNGVIAAATRIMFCLKCICSQVPAAVFMGRRAALTLSSWGSAICCTSFSTRASVVGKVFAFACVLQWTIHALKTTLCMPQPPCPACASMSSSAAGCVAYSSYCRLQMGSLFLAVQNIKVHMCMQATLLHAPGRPTPACTVLSVTATSNCRA